MSTSVSSVTSHFPSAENGFTTTLASTISSGAATVPLNSVAGYANGEVVVFIVDPSDLSKKQSFTGTVDTSGVQITGVVWTSGTNQTHTAGATVVDYVDAAHISMVSKGLLVGHNQDGTHKTSLPLTTPQITTSINDSNGNEVIKTPATASAVNEITVTNAATGNAPKVSATGGDTNINLNLQGKGTGNVTINGTKIFSGFDYVQSGCVWSGDAYGSTRVASMTAGVVVINGNPLTVAAVTSRTFTASKDTYVDFNDNGDGTAAVTYTEVTNNAASPALTANYFRNAIIVTGASNIANVGSINQGQEDKVLPIASNVAYAVTDSLGNLICNRNPNRVILGAQKKKISDTSASGTYKVTPLSVTFISDGLRKVKVTGAIEFGQRTSAANYVANTIIKESSTTLAFGRQFGNGASASLNTAHPVAIGYLTPTAGIHTYDIYCAMEDGTNMSISNGQDSFLMVELA